MKDDRPLSVGDSGPGEYGAAFEVDGEEGVDCLFGDVELEGDMMNHKRNRKGKRLSCG